MTPLENWIKRKIGLQGSGRLSQEDLSRYQLQKVQETLAYARVRSPFYRSSYSGEIHLQALKDIGALPFTTAEDLCERPLEFLCVSQGDVSRVVTLQTWEARPKRLFFTDSDLELTIDFFHHGMSGIVEPGQRVLILMPGERPGSVGDLLIQALGRIDVEGIVHGPVQDPLRTIEEIAAKQIDCLIGIPTHVLSLARHTSSAQIPPGRIKSVLLSSDYVAQAIVDEVTRAWRCPVFEHYGMTEMGLGGGVHCSAHAGYHLREADLFFEIIDPATGQPLPEGETGEVIFTTLTRKAMPLLRYRTGDLARFIPGSCPCGTMLRRMDRIQGRLKGAVTIGRGRPIGISELDERLFKVPGVLDYEIEICRGKEKDHLRIRVLSAFQDPKLLSFHVQEALKGNPSIMASIEEGALKLDDPVVSGESRIEGSMAKRKIRDSRL